MALVKPLILTAGIIAQLAAGDTVADWTTIVNKPTTLAGFGITDAEAVANKSTNTALGTSNTLYPTQNAVKAYVDASFAANDAMIFRGVIDCSANPNYPAADKGDTYRVSVAGKIGGAAGPNVEAGDLLICITDGTAAGNHATVGANWTITQTNLDGAVIGPASVTAGNPAVFSGTSGKLIAQVTFAAFKTSLAIAAADVSGLSTFATSTDLANATGTLANARVADNSLSPSRQAFAATSRVLGRVTAGAGAGEELTSAQVSTFLGLATIATSASASDLTSGTVANGRISGSYSGFFSITLSGNVIGSGASLLLLTNSVDGADDSTVQIWGGGGNATTRGAGVRVFGNEHASQPGNLILDKGLSGAGKFVLTGIWSDVLFGSKTYDPASTATAASNQTTVTVTGAVVGDLCMATFSLITTTKWHIWATVSVADTVTVTLFNETGGTVDLGSGTLRVWVIKV